VGVEPTGDGVTRRPPVLKTGVVTGPHALPLFSTLTVYRVCLAAGFLGCETLSREEPGMVASRDHRNLRPFSNRAKEAFAFEMQNDLLRRFLGSQVCGIDDDFGVVGFFVGI
jgi:hypothetical protein